MPQVSPLMPTDVARTADADNGSTADPVELDVPKSRHRLGRYQLLLPLAGGGMGVVFAGRLLGSHGVERLVAIKTLRPVASSSHRAALLREARLTSRLHHRNVVATLDLDEAGDVPYAVMELVDGVSLSKLLAKLASRGEPLSPDLAAWIAMQCALGLHAAHELTDGGGRPLHLVHRDVSPQNILLATTGEVKLADFGVAKFVGRDESTATGTIKGKFGYMSPEQAESDEVDRRSDVFSLGIVLWEALTGARLFSTDSPARTLLRVRELQPGSPVDLRPEVGDELSSITLRCLAKDPALRYASAADVADALRAALRSRGSVVDESDLAALVVRLFGAERAEFTSRLRSSVARADSQRARAASRPRRRALGFVAASAALVAITLSFLATRTVARSEQAAGAVAAPLAHATELATSSPVETSPALPPPPAVSVPEATTASKAPRVAPAAPRSPRAGTAPGPHTKPAPSASPEPTHAPVQGGSPFETL
jgi:serine/threonine-protein kinase